MNRFAKYLHSGENLHRHAGVSPLALVADGVILAVFVVGYWVGSRALIGWSASSRFADTFEPMLDTLFTVLTLSLGLVALAAFLSIVLRALFRHYGLSDSRVLLATPLRVRAAEIAHVQDVEVSQNILGKMLGFGDVIVHTASSSDQLKLRGVAAPHEWFREIHESVRTTGA